MKASTEYPLPADVVGEVRRSQVVSTWGPGAIIDLRLKSGAPVSGIVCGLEAWDEAAPPGNKGSRHPQIIIEPRLQAKLGNKKAFRLPPVRNRRKDQGHENTIPVERFPTWLQCPSCDRLRRADGWGKKIGAPDRWCGHCLDSKNLTISPVPVRFVVACEAGHLDEFPFKWWAGCKCTKPDLRMKTTGAGLSGKSIACAECRAERSLAGAFHRDALMTRQFRCSGTRPWLPGAPNEPCTQPPRVLQRGASNVYWGNCESALDVPPFSLDLEQVLGRVWPYFQDATEDRWPQKIEAFDLPTALKMTPEAILGLLKDWKKGATPSEGSLLMGEYKNLEKAMHDPVSEGNFDATPEVVPDEFATHVEGIAAARRLREVRVLTGFTRIYPPSGSFSSKQQVLTPIAAKQQELDWLPGIELRGEGIFIGLSADRVKQWETRPDVVERQEKLLAAVKRELRPREPLPDCSARFLMIHSLAHAVMRQLSLDCGYSSSALRERLYVAEGAEPMLGLLIQTGSPDSEGTLGGLVRQARVDLFATTLTAALKAQVWCSSDPLCITGVATLSSPRNGAACHACQLVPETSCSHFNVLLDRALLVGTDGNPALGYFGELVRSL